MINQNGEIIGINTLTIKDSQNLNFAISVSELNSLVYNTPLTLTQVYEKECDAFTKLANFIISNGEYDYEDKEYYYYAGADTLSSGSIFSTASYYSISTGEIELAIVYEDFILLITMTNDSAPYIYLFYDTSSAYYLSGNIYQNSFSSSTSSLSYNYTNISSSSLLQSGKSLATSLAKMLITYVDIDYASIGVTAYDLGFIRF